MQQANNRRHNSCCTSQAVTQLELRKVKCKTIPIPNIMCKLEGVAFPSFFLVIILAKLLISFAKINIKSSLKW